MVAAFSRSTLCWLTAVLAAASVEPYSIQHHSDVTLAGSDITIRCKIADIDKRLDMTQITWQRRTGMFPAKDNFLTVAPRERATYVPSGERNWEEERDRVKFIGDFHKFDASLLIRNARAKDSGTYTCIFTLFPSGNQNVNIEVRVWTKPRISVLAIPSPAAVGCSEQKSPLAVCTAAGGDPEPKVRWVHGNDTTVGKDDWESAVSTTTETRQGDAALEGSVERIVESVLMGAVSAEWNGDKAACVIESPDGGVLYAETMEVRLNVTYAPEVPTVTLNGETGELECQADGNPPANMSWERPDEITWECVAENENGASRSRVYRVESTPARVTAAMYGALCLAVGTTALCIVLCIVLLWCRGRRRAPSAIQLD